MPATIELDDADKAALVALLKQAIAADPFPMSHRTRLLQGILAKLNPPPATDPSHRRAGKRHQPPSGGHWRKSLRRKSPE